MMVTQTPSHLIPSTVVQKLWQQGNLLTATSLLDQCPFSRNGCEVANENLLSLLAHQLGKQIQSSLKFPPVQLACAQR